MPKFEIKYHLAPCFSQKYEKPIHPANISYIHIFMNGVTLSRPPPLSLLMVYSSGHGQSAERKSSSSLSPSVMVARVDISRYRNLSG